MTGMPAISLWQPYAQLIAIGAKPWETRHWPVPPRLMGVRVAIHAAKRKPTRDDLEFGDPSGAIAAALGGSGWEQRVRYGVFLCSAVTSGCYQVRDVFDEPGGLHVTLCGGFGASFLDDGFGDYRIGRYCWRLTDVQPFERPMQAKGQQGFWYWDGRAAA